MAYFLTEAGVVHKDCDSNELPLSNKKGDHAHSTMKQLLDTREKKS